LTISKVAVPGNRLKALANEQRVAVSTRFGALDHSRRRVRSNSWRSTIADLWEDSTLTAAAIPCTGLLYLEQRFEALKRKYAFKTTPKKKRLKGY
jgi:hypothetical protein